MNALIVGAGAVGQVYGYHLQQGGARVGVLVKEKYAAAAREGFPLYPLNRRRPRRAPVRFSGADVLTDASQVEPGAWDQVWLCMSSTGLRGPWLDTLTDRLGDATLVALQPGLEDREYIAARYPLERIVSGMISLVSYPAPLEAETVPEPGVAYWFPPLSPSPFSGPRDRLDPVVGALRKGKQPAKRAPDVGRASAFPSAVLMSVVATLEACGWSFARLRREKKGLPRIPRAARQMIAVAGRKRDARPPFGLRLLLRPLILRLLLRVSPWFVPFDLETYLRVHFTKVGDQTRFALARYAELGREYDLPTTEIDRLLTDLG